MHSAYQEHLKVVKMPDKKQDPSNEELYKAGKMDRRRAARPSLVPGKTDEPDIEENIVGIKLRPEAVVIAVMMVILLIIAAFAI